MSTGIIKAGQAWTLVLNLPNDMDDLSSAVSASILYQSPVTGTTGEWSGTLDTSAETVTYAVPNDTTNEVGLWKFVAKVTFSDGSYIYGGTYTHAIWELYETETA